MGAQKVTQPFVYYKKGAIFAARNNMRNNK